MTSAPGSSTRLERTQSLNGRMAPLESFEEKVVSEGPGGRVIERLVRRFDPTGRPGGSEKVRIEESKNPDGSTNRRTTTWQGDLNGRFQLTERSTTVATKSGDAQRSETAVERATLNGSIELTERRVAVESETKDRYTAEVTAYRKSQSGSFAEAARETTERRTAEGRTTETQTQYNATNTGRLEFVGQRVSRLDRRPDGSETEIVDVYGAAAPGRTVAGSPVSPALREQQVIERIPGEAGSMTETFGVRRPALADSGQLGPLQKISETRCTGNCAAR